MAKYIVRIKMKDGSEKIIDTDVAIRNIPDQAYQNSARLAFFICDPSIDPLKIETWTQEEVRNG